MVIVRLSLTLQAPLVKHTTTKRTTVDYFKFFFRRIIKGLPAS